MARYKVTGVDRSGRRFRVFTDNGIHAMGINVWRGTKWENVDGTWRIRQRIWNY